MFQCGCAILVLAIKTGDEVVNQLGDRGVLADDDETWGNLGAIILPALEGFLIMAVQGLHRRLQAQWEAGVDRVPRFGRVLSWAYPCGYFPKDP